MALEQNFQDSMSHFEPSRDASLKQKWNSIQDSSTASDNISGCFDCNICLDSAQDPVVTHCGHLYCWPCIYKWLHILSSSPESDDEQQPKCPVCKANMSYSSLIPLYGRGRPSSDSETKRFQQDVIPHRPPAIGVNSVLTSQQLHPNTFPPQPQESDLHRYFPHPFSGYASVTSSDFGSASMSSFFSPTVGMFGEMVSASMFGSSGTSLFTYPNAYPLVGSGHSRMRGQEVLAEKSLNRVSLFLFCCFILCLLLF